MKRVDVAVGVIVRDQQVYICKRADHLHQGGKWEFPGGKQEPGEDIATALVRELDEEIGIKVTAQQPLTVIEHDYSDKHVRLDVRLVTAFDGEPRGREGQIGRWVAMTDIQQYTFPDANQVIIEALLRRT